MEKLITHNTRARETGWCFLSEGNAFLSQREAKAIEHYPDKELKIVSWG